MDPILKYFPELTVCQRDRFAALGPLYAEWNGRVNVISRRDMEEFYLRHVLHSLAVAKFLRGSLPVVNCRLSILDIGTGGGFPAVPLAIMFPGMHFTAVDSIGKKIMVVEQVVRALSLENLTPVNARAEGVPGMFDFVVSRAVAPAKMLVDWAYDKVISSKASGENHAFPGGMILLKGGDLEQELSRTGKEYAEHDISDWFSEPFFETKKVVFIKK